MPSHPSAGMKLRCIDGHWEWADFELQPLPDGTFGMAAACDYGTHYLQPVGNGSDALHAPCVPYGWPTAREAFAARDRYEQQDNERERRKPPSESDEE